MQLKTSTKIFNSNNIITLNINNSDYFFVGFVTIYQALLQKGWYIPRFCYHVKLALAGNCRMCFVEVAKIAKPVIACATLINKDMNLFTSSLLVLKAREGILEFLLINHPIDCPICDQGGECDLQDQYIIMGPLTSRYYENSKKSIINKNLSFLINLSLNKCINCTRCTRYSQNVLGDYSFSLLGRGENSVISNYISNIFVGEMTGNVMDLCPVGALTSKLISYDFRVWELIDVKYIDFLDIMHPPIRIDFRGLKIIRILPLSNSVIQEEWISDKLRYNFKSLFKARFFLPYIKKQSYYITFSWINTILILKNSYLKLIHFYNKKKLFFLNTFKFCQNTTDIYKYIVFKSFFKKLCFFNFKRFSYLNTSRNDYLFVNKNLDFLDIDNFLFFNVNLRYDMPLLNFKIREKLIFDYINIFLFGPVLELNYFFKHLGNNLASFFFAIKSLPSFKKKNNILFYSAHENAKNTMLFFILKLNNNFQFYNLFNTTNLSLLNQEFYAQKNVTFNKFKTFYSSSIINNNDYYFSTNSFTTSKQFTSIITQNVHNIKNFFFIFPAKFNFEQNSIFLNIFGIYNDFTFLNYKSNFRTLKNDWFLVESLAQNFGLKFTFSISKIKKKFIPDNWIFNDYNINIFKFSFVKYPLISFDVLSYISTLVPSFFNDIFSKNNTLFQYFDKIKKFNIFNYFSKINSVHWIF